MSVQDVLELLNAARTAQDFVRAERAARRLPPRSQLEVVDAYRAARARCC